MKTTAGMQVSLYRTLQKSAFLLPIMFLFKIFYQFIYLENDSLKLKGDCLLYPNTTQMLGMEGKKEGKGIAWWLKFFKERGKRPSDK